VNGRREGVVRAMESGDDGGKRVGLPMLLINPRRWTALQVGFELGYVQ